MLGYLDEIKVCTGYEIDGQVTDKFPVPAKLGRAKPVFTTLPGWKCDIRGHHQLCRPAGERQGLCGLFGAAYRLPHPHRLHRPQAP